jgi:hypothetical protein
MAAMTAITHLDADQLAAGLDHIRAAPADAGELAMIVRRPAVDEREVLAEATLDPAVGLVGDTWLERGSNRTPDGSAHPPRQLTLMNVRCALLVAGGRDRAPLAGDQLYVDLDLSTDNLPVGARLHIGDAVLEVTEPSHLGCAKFVERFGADAMAFVNSPIGRRLRLRGMYTQVVTGGVVRIGDSVTAR